MHVIVLKILIDLIDQLMKCVVYIAGFVPFIDKLFDEIRMLDEHQFKALFPAAEIVHEKFLFLTKSLIAIKR